MKVFISFLGNCFYDTRVTNLSASLKGEGCTVSIVSFDWLNSNIPYAENGIKIFKLKRGKVNILFYLSFAYRLITELIKSKDDIYFAEDVYSLPFVTIIGKIKRGKIIYNSRELYAFIGGLANRPVIQFLIKTIENFFIRRVDLVLTTGEMDSEFLEKFYGIRDTLVLRNLPQIQKPSRIVDLREMFNISTDKTILLYQGVIQGGRGIKLLLHAMAHIPKAAFVILGEGEKRTYYEKLCEELNIADKVFFTGVINQKELINYTAGGDIGLAIIENISISYYHALPHKIFEYIMADLPVLASNLPQMKKVIDHYKVGETLAIEQDDNLVKVINKLIENPILLAEYKKNCAAAVKELNWQVEFEKCKKEY